MKARTEESLIFLDPLRGRAGSASEFDGVVSGEVGEWVHFEVRPDPFHGVEFGSIRGKEQDLNPFLALEELLHADRPVRPQTIPEQDKPSREMHGQLAKEGDEVIDRHVLVRQEGEVRSQALPLRREGDRGDHGDLLSGACALVEDGSRPDRSPGAPEEGCHQKPALVKEDQVTVQLLGVFFTRRHFSLTHRWISRSFRSRALRSGFCGEKPIDRRSRAT